MGRGISYGLLLVGLCACAIYQPPQLPADQVAIVEPPVPQWGNKLYVDRIDGLPPDVPTAMHPGTGGTYSKAITLAPGKHTLRVKAQLGLHYGFADIWLVAEPGRTYRINKDSHGYTFSAWFEDESGRKIGGVVGSDDEPPSETARIQPSASAERP